MDHFSILPDDIHNLICLYLNYEQLNNIIKIYNPKLNYRFLFDYKFAEGFLFKNIVNFNIINLYTELLDASELFKTNSAIQIVAFFNKYGGAYPHPSARKYLLENYKIKYAEKC